MGKDEAALAKKEQPKGLFQYFRKETEEESRQHHARMDEEIRNGMEIVEYQTEIAKQNDKDKDRTS